MIDELKFFQIGEIFEQFLNLFNYQKEPFEVVVQW